MIILRTAWLLRTSSSRLGSTSVARVPPHSPRSSWGRSRDTFITQCLDILHRQTNDPLWRLLRVLGRPHSGDRLATALNHASVSISDYRLYQQCLQANDAEPALPALSITRASAQLSTSDRVPTWVFLHLLTKRRHTPFANLDVLLDPLLSQVSTLPLHQRVPMLIFAAAHFSTSNLLLPLERVVHEFLSLPHPIVTPVMPSEIAIPNASQMHAKPKDVSTPAMGILTFSDDPQCELYFNLFLRALACTPKYSTAYFQYIVSTIKRMTSLSDSQYKIHADTYSCLLVSTHNEMEPRNTHHQARILSPRVVEYLWNRMRVEDFKASPKHFEALLRFWAKEAVGGSNASTKRGLRANVMIQQVWEQLQSFGDTDRLKSGAQAKLILRANTLYLGVQGSISDVREVLDIAQKSSATSAVISNALPPPPVRHSPTLPKTNTHLDRYALISTLHSAANDISVSGTALAKMFYKLVEPYGGPSKAPLAAHTVVLRGLVFRKHFDRARRWWMHYIVKSKFQLDRMSLAVGAQILTRSNRPHEAFATLEKYSWKPAVSSLVATKTKHKPVRLSSISVNEWTVSLKRIARPDVVFQLWDYMYPLYGVLHTNETLNVILQSARMAVVMDARSVRTQISNYFKLGRAKFSSSSPSPPHVLLADPEVRNHATDHIRSLLGDIESEHPKPYRGVLWRGKRPEDTARDIFLQVMFGMETEMVGSGMSLAYSATTRNRAPKVGLANVHAPACSVRSGWDSDAGAVGLGVGLVELKLSRFEYKPGPEMYDWSKGASSDGPGRPRSLYPHLVLDNTNFLMYLSLLSVTNRTPEVALTMAWMRELGIQPSESTLALAMVLWGEISVEGPLIQAVAGPRRGCAGEDGPVDEYDRFVMWLEGWVGRRRIPDVDALRKWRLIVKKMREARAPSQSNDMDAE